MDSQTTSLKLGDSTLSGPFVEPVHWSAHTANQKPRAAEMFGRPRPRLPRDGELCGRWKGGGVGGSRTSDDEAGRRLSLAHTVLRHAGESALVAGRRLLHSQHVVVFVVFDLIPGDTHTQVLRVNHLYHPVLQPESWRNFRGWDWPSGLAMGVISVVATLLQGLMVK